jgi:hypothetical protein
MFEKILKGIEFNDDFVIKSDEFLKKIQTNKKINVIHLRLEEDAIIHWSKKNKMSQSDFKSYLETKYIGIIEKYNCKDDFNLILSHSFSNRVIDHLNELNIEYSFVDKFFDDREKNAIIDLLASRCCNNLFIGNFNIIRSNGSTFSYYIGNILNPDTVKIYIDLDKIVDPEKVI